MRWAIRAVVLASVVCSVISTETNDVEPRLIIMARSTVYNVGETRAIYCQGVNIQETIDWYKPSGEKIKDKTIENNRVYVERKNETTGPLAALIMHDILIKDGGNWTCKSGELSETREFIVGEKVIITDRNVTMEGEEGKSIKLTCEAKGQPPPVVVWYRDNSVPIPNDLKKYVIKQDNTLEIKKLNHMDVGIYVCKVRQKALSYYTDKTVQLSVQHKPVIIRTTPATYTTKYKTEEVYAILNETKNITCKAIANPPPTYRWYRRQKGYDSDIIVDSETVITSDDGTNSVLVLRMYNESYLGEYKCAASNSRGQESIVFDVTLGTKPDPPNFVVMSANNVSYVTFNVTCTTCILEIEEGLSPNPQNLTITGYSFQLTPEKKNYPPDWDVDCQEFTVDIENPENTLFTIGPLPNSTTFHAQVRTRNAAGFSEWVMISPSPFTTDDASRLVSAFAMVIVAFVLTLY